MVADRPATSSLSSFCDEHFYLRVRFMAQARRGFRPINQPIPSTFENNDVYQTITGNIPAYLLQHQNHALTALQNDFTNPQCYIRTVVLPTGCGKSGVIVCAPYYFKSHRCLVVAPSLQIRKQLAKDFVGEADYDDHYKGSFFVKIGGESVFHVTQNDF